MKGNFVFFLNDISGGVVNLVDNILLFINKDNFNFRIIITHKKDIIINSKVNGFSSKIQVDYFYYQYNENIYSICKRLSKYINPDDIIVSSDWLELCMVSNLGLQNKVLFFLHGDYEYYYELAKSNDAAIDIFICVSKYINDKLKNILPDRANDIHYLPLVIKEVKVKTEINYNKPLNIIFIGRLSYEKGYYLLPKINNWLLNNKIIVNWYIASGYLNLDTELHIWQNRENVHFLGNVHNQVLLNSLHKYDIFILPSHAEGFPLSLIESMKAGLVPLVSDLPSGIPELIEPGVTGYVYDKEDVNGFANIIKILDNNRLLLSILSQNASKKALDCFNPYENIKAFQLLFINIISDKNVKVKKAKKVFRSRLDNKIIPNFITIFIRNIYKHNIKVKLYNPTI